MPSYSKLLRSPDLQPFRLYTLCFDPTHRQTPKLSHTVPVIPQTSHVNTMHCLKHIRSLALFSLLRRQGDDGSWTERRAAGSTGERLKTLVQDDI